MRKLFVLAVIVAVLIAADITVRNVAERKTASELRTRLELGSTPDVKISGFPFLWGALTGEFDAVTVRMDGFGHRDDVLGRVRLTLNEVTFSIGELVDGFVRLRVASGSGSALIPIDRIERALGPAGDLLGQGLDELPPLTVDGDRLDVGFQTILLPRLNDAMSYSSARVTKRGIALRFEVDRTTLDLSSVRGGLVLDL